MGDIVAGQQSLNERLGVDSALKALTADLAGLDRVESASYTFDAGDVSSTAGLEVGLSSTDFPVWHDVVSRIAAVGDREAMAGYPIAVTMRTPSVVAFLSTPNDTGWLDDGVLALVTDAIAAFPGSLVILSSAGPDAAGISVSVADSAETLLTRTADDPGVTSLIAAAASARHWLTLDADGLELTGTPDPASAEWAREVLAADVPRYPVSRPGDAAGDFEAPREWGSISLGGAADATTISANWFGPDAPGAGGGAWRAFVTAMRATASGLETGSACVPVYLSYQWSGAVRSVSAATCGLGLDDAVEWPGLATARAALAAEGIDPEQLGFQLS